MGANGVGPPTATVNGTAEGDRGGTDIGLIYPVYGLCISHLVVLMS